MDSWQDLARLHIEDQLAYYQECPPHFYVLSETHTDTGGHDRVQSGLVCPAAQDVLTQLFEADAANNLLIVWTQGLGAHSVQIDSLTPSFFETLDFGGHGDRGFRIISRGDGKLSMDDLAQLNEHGWVGRILKNDFSYTLEHLSGYVAILYLLQRQLMLHARDLIASLTEAAENEASEHLLADAGPGAGCLRRAACPDNRLISQKPQ